MKQNGLTASEFEALIAKAYERLPEWVKDKVRNVALIAEDVAGNDVVKGMNLESDMDLLGLYQGVPLTDRDYGLGLQLPDSIHLYRLPIQEDSLETGKPVSEVVFETLWHEIAHYFGLDEDEVLEREDERFS
jgi:predicted Zn-dependent protease with MMP-like domain